MSISNNFPAIKPTLLLDFANTKTLDPRITFTRSTTATYYDGVTTAKSEENLLTYSEQFDNAAWAKTNATVTANATTAPDGTTTADTINGSAGSAYILEALTVTSGITYTFSVYAKANTTNFLQIAGGSSGFGTGVWANFDLSGGTVGTTGALTTASIQSIGSGWYRCVITGTATASISPGNIFALIPVESSSATRFPTNAGTTSIYVWGAQLEQRSSVTAYTATTTQPITNYIPVLQTAASGVPRFDHNPTTDESLGLLIEEQRTNLLLRSDDFANASWTKGGTTITANSTVAPDGTITADTLVENTANSQHQTFQAVTLTAAPYTWSVYVKQSAGNKRWLSMYPQGTGVNAYAVFDVSLGTVTLTGLAQYLSSSITPVGNGWYRCAITFTGAAVSVNHVAYLSDSATVPAPVYTGDGWSGLFLWGAQLEAGAFATSYIPTVASTVTRNADAASMTGTNFSSWYSAAEGTLFTDFVITRTGSNDMSAAIIQGANTNDAIYIYAQPQSSRFRGDVYVGGVTQCALAYTAAGAPTSGTPYKAALAYKVNDFAMSINAATVSTDTSGTVPVVDRMAIGATAAAATFLNGTIKKIAYYPLRVTNAQLQALTS